MKSYTLKIRWLQTEETIFFDPNASLQPGDVIETYEYWDAYPDPIKYVVEVAGATRIGSKYTLELIYSAESNPHIAAINVAWGTSTIAIDLQTDSATAKWQNIPPNQQYDGEAPVIVTTHDLTEDLGFIVTQRRKRRQAQFRRALEEFASCCEISGETAGPALEAAHIIEVKDDGGYAASNGILLRADLHRLFDSGALTINLDGSVVLDPLVPENSRYRTEAASWRIQDGTLRRIWTALERRNRNDR